MENIREFLAGFGREDLHETFMEHFKLGTADVFIVKGNIVAAVNWNISRTGKVAYILDLFIKDGYDSVRIMRYFGFKGKKKFPSIEYIKFQRNTKFGSDGSRIYKLSRLIRG